MRDILNTNGDPVKLHDISQRHRVPNAFYRLPFADRMMGVAGACTWETMHAIDLGLIEYQIESFHDILGGKNVAAADKNYSTNTIAPSASTWISRARRISLAVRDESIISLTLA